MKTTIAAIALVGSLLPTYAAEITWTVQHSTGSEADVRTDGNVLYAYTPSTTEIKAGGVQFGRYTQEAGTADTTCSISNIVGDAVFNTTVTRNRNVDWRVAGSVAPTSGDGYLKLLSWGWYQAAASAPASLTLNGLTSGKRYLVQIWICDTRNEVGGKNKKLTIGDKTGDCYGNGYGSNFVGTFTADGASQAIALSYTGEAQFNAFQVRCLDEATISWTSTWTSGESDIRTDGALCYAYKPRDSVDIANVHFSGSGTTSGITTFGKSDDPDIRYSKPIVNPHGDFCWEDASVPDGAISYSAAYRKLIDAGLFENYFNQWSTRYNRRTVTLRHLTPGKRYLVQLWVIDNRAVDYKDATMVVGFGTVMAHNNGVQYGHGSYAVGTFTAVAAEQPISFYHRSASEAFKAGASSSYESYGPIQVRCLDDEDENVWYVGDTGTDGSVDTRGQPLWAFSGVRTTVAGTPFSNFNKDNSGDFGELVVKTGGAVESQTWHRGNAFISTAKVEVAPAVTNLLGGGIYNNNADTVNHVLELHKLTAGKRYLIQAWFLDSRKTRSGTFGGQRIQFRIVSGDTVGGVAYNYDRAPLGQYVTGIFRATGECHEVQFNMGAMQLNAIQVRELDAAPIDSEIRWGNDQTQGGSGSVSTEGTLLYAYAPYAFTAENGVAFAEGAYRTTDIGGGNVVLEHAFAEKNDCFAPNETSPLFKCAWYTYSGGVQIGDNTVTLGNLKPTYEYLVQVFVADLRNSGCGTRTLGIKDRTGRYGPDNDSAFPHGSVFSGRFTANAPTKSFVLKYASSAVAQLNAIQVREIGPKQPVRVLQSSAAWTTDGTGWTIGGQDQTGTVLWDAAHGGSYAAFVGGNASLALGEDVTVGAVYGSGELTIGTVGTESSISVGNEIDAPLATVNAVWADAIVRKFATGTTVLAGACPILKEVKVYGGRVVLDGAVLRPLELTVVSPGVLGFTTNRVLSVSSFAGDGSLAGPGGIVLADGTAYAVPASVSCVEGFTWSLANGSTLALPANYDASQLRVSIDDPGSYLEELVVTHDGTATGRPQFVYGRRGFRAVKEGGGWRIKGAGMMMVFR